MNFYAYKGKHALGNEPLGTDNKMIIKDLKSVRGAIKRCKSMWGQNFKLYSYTEFYNNHTFKEIA